jgi:CubicO group peptidase (beta-lactamase class C family)
MVDPADAGFDPAALDAIAETARVGKSRCLAVARNGALVREWYFADATAASTQNVFSVTKSITSTLVGIAQDDGSLRIDQPASTWITEWRGTPSESVTVRNLLSNDSGREWSLGIDYGQLIRAPDATAFAIGLGQTSPPGQVWAYNNSAIQTLQRVLEAATGQDVATFARARLFEPIGMAASSMGTDATGHALMYQGVRSNCQDLARFGTLLADRGRWGTEQIVSEAWVDQATGASSTPLNAAYGFLWWLNRPGPIGGALAATGVGDAAPETGQLAAGAPEDMFWALGLGNQVVQVDPGSGTVVVRLGTAEFAPKPPTFGRADATRVVTEALVD